MYIIISNNDDIIQNVLQIGYKFTGKNVQMISNVKL